MSSQRTATVRTTSTPARPDAPASSVQPSPRGGPPLLNSGLELLRDTNT